MNPKTRVLAALEHREPDRIPWGEHSIDYNVYEDILLGGLDDIRADARYAFSSAAPGGRLHHGVVAFARGGREA